MASSIIPSFLSCMFHVMLFQYERLRKRAGWLAGADRGIQVLLLRSAVLLMTPVTRGQSVTLRQNL